MLAKLVPYPTDANGFMIGADIPFAKSHRHYSHMLAVYPLYQVNWAQPDEPRPDREVARRTGSASKGALQGYTLHRRRLDVGA